MGSCLTVTRPSGTTRLQPKYCCLGVQVSSEIEDDVYRFPASVSSMECGGFTGNSKYQLASYVDCTPCCDNPAGFDLHLYAVAERAVRLAMVDFEVNKSR
ncbi:Px [Papaya lethal yellowing virus]|uniref:Px n=1 Tax=Papaya lethal yellowing virus TaxID=685899 RepID=UPI0003D406AD|nr:Px [Papaya lethal yellowing virus]